MFASFFFSGNLFSASPPSHLSAVNVPWQSGDYLENHLVFMHANENELWDAVLSDMHVTDGLLFSLTCTVLYLLN